MTEIIDGFKFQKEIDGSKKLIIESSRLNECIKYILEGNASSITINYFQGYKLDNINFLVELSEVLLGLHLPETKFNIEIVNKLYKLNFLGIADNKKDIIDLLNFPDLEVLACDYSNRLNGLETCLNLRNLTLTNFNPKINNITKLLKLSKIEHLNLFKTNIINIESIDNLSKLRNLKIFMGNKLEIIEPLKSLKNLEEIHIEKCKNIKDFETLGEIVSLKKIILSECGEIKNLKFIKKLPNLEFLSFWNTIISDGNLSYCKDLNFVGFKNRKGYSHTLSDFKK
jgi:hypothetical protein